MADTATKVVGADGTTYYSGNVDQAAQYDPALDDINQQSDQPPGEDNQSCGQLKGQAAKDDYADVGNAFQAFSKFLQPAIQAMNNMFRGLPRFPVTGISDAIHSQPIQAAAKVERRIQAVETGMVKNTPGGLVGTGIATVFPPARLPFTLIGAANMANEAANVDPNNREEGINRAIENSAFPFFPGRPQQGRMDTSKIASEPLAGIVERGVNLPPAGTAAKAALDNPSVLGLTLPPPPKGGGQFADQTLRMPGFMRDYDRQLNVRIFTPNELANLRVVPGPNGQLTYANSGQPVVSNGQHIYVMDQHGNLYVARAQEGVIHHSSLAGPNANPYAGGHIMTDANGRITGITEDTGHFRSQPSGRSDSVRDELAHQGFDTTYAITHHYGQ